jgi:hypothetical protein
VLTSGFHEILGLRGATQKTKGAAGVKFEVGHAPGFLSFSFSFSSSFSFL